MSIPDNMIAKYFELLTDLPIPEIRAFEAKMKAGENPRNYKVLLGKTIVAQYHSQEASEKVEEEFNRIFRDKGIPDEMDELALTAETSLIDALVASKTVPSKSEARRLFQQNAVSIAGEKVTDENMKLKPGAEVIIKVGKRKFLKVK